MASSSPHKGIDVLAIGVDVGGTNTDAVIIKQAEVICTAKTPTTADVTSGLEKAIRKAISQLPAPYVSSDIQRVNIGTTHFVNAVVQRRDVVPVTVLRLCGPASRSVPPFSDFPEDLRRVLGGPYYFLSGGYEYDGTTITEVDEEEVRKVANEIGRTEIRNVVITGVFSPVNAQQEEQVKDIIQKTNPSISVTVSHDVGLIGFLERENASILNESLKPLCLRTVNAFQNALEKIGLKCPFYLTQNDGTIMSAEKAVEFPVLTFESGPTNSMRGAAHLSNVKDAIVVDIGGTTADVGILVNGFPRQSSTRVKVGGVNTNFRMPDVLSIGLGGGSHVHHNSHTGEVTIGPQSVGYRLEKEAMVFGGDVMTATDIAVAASLTNIGDRRKASVIPDLVRKAALATIKKMVEDAIDQVKISGENQPVILVGGGTIIIDRKWQLVGASEFHVPPNFKVANAVGAALSKVSGTIDSVFSLEGTTEQEVVNMAETMAHQEALKNGAEASTIEIVESLAISLSYLPGSVTRIQVKAVGDLANVHDQENVEAAKVDEGEDVRLLQPLTLPASHDVDDEEEVDPSGRLLPESVPPADNIPLLSQEVEKSNITPHVEQNTGDWLINEFDVECMAIGAGILGCGGGGSPYIGKLRIQQLIKSGKEIRIIHPDRLGRNSDPVVSVACMGAPTVCVEKLPSGVEICSAIKSLEPFMTKSTRFPACTCRCLSDRSFSAVVCDEIGGGNCFEPLAVAAELDIPIVDADGMGRAFPEFQMLLPFVYGCKPYPVGLADEKGNTLVVTNVQSAKDLERHCRVICIQMGCIAATAYVLAADKMKETYAKYSYSRAWRLGNAVLQARKAKGSPIDAILHHEGGRLLFKGKVSYVGRREVHGFVEGTVTIAPITEEDQQSMTVKFKNENYLAYFQNENGTKNIQACVPDLISLVDSETGEPVPTEEVRYGLRIAVLAMCCSPLWTTPEGLKVVGPGAFGYNDVKYVPVGEYLEHPPIPQPKKDSRRCVIL